MNIAWNMRREHLPVTQRSHYVISNGGGQPNVVPGEASVWYYFRERSFKEIQELYDLANVISEAAATMSGTTVTRQVLGYAAPNHGNRPLAEAAHQNMVRVGMPTLVAVLFLPTALASVTQWVIIWRLRLVHVSVARVNLAEALSMARLGSAFLLTELFAMIVFQSGALIIAQKFGAAQVTPYAVTARMALVTTLRSINATATSGPAAMRPARGELDCLARRAMTSCSAKETTILSPQAAARAT
jgi:hypothetical protein